MRQRRPGTTNAIEQVRVFRIDVTSGGTKIGICVVGELLAQGVGEFKRTATQTGESLELDLSDLTFADDDGVRALRRLIDDGASVIGGSPLIKKLLTI